MVYIKHGDLRLNLLFMENNTAKLFDLRDFKKVQELEFPNGIKDVFKAHLIHFPRPCSMALGCMRLEAKRKTQTEVRACAEESNSAVAWLL